MWHIYIKLQQVYNLYKCRPPITCTTRKPALERVERLIGAHNDTKPPCRSGRSLDFGHPTEYDVSYLLRAVHRLLRSSHLLPASCLYHVHQLSPLVTNINNNTSHPPSDRVSDRSQSSELRFLRRAPIYNLDVSVCKRIVSATSKVTSPRTQQNNLNLNYGKLVCMLRFLNFTAQILHHHQGRLSVSHCRAYHLLFTDLKHVSTGFN